MVKRDKSKFGFVRTFPPHPPRPWGAPGQSIDDLAGRPPKPSPPPPPPPWLMARLWSPPPVLFLLDLPPPPPMPPCLRQPAPLVRLMVQCTCVSIRGSKERTNAKTSWRSGWVFGR